MTLEEKGEKIIQDIEKETGVSPVRIFKNMAKKDYISMHGPEHHVLDGAPYDGSIVYMGVKDDDGNICYVIGVTKQIRKAIGKT